MASFKVASLCNWLLSCSLNLWIALFQLLKPVSKKVLHCRLEKDKRPCFRAFRQLAQNILYFVEQTVIQGYLLYQLCWIVLEYVLVPSLLSLLSCEYVVLDSNTFSAWWGVLGSIQAWHSHAQASDPPLSSRPESSCSSPVSVVSVCNKKHNVSIWLVEARYKEEIPGS